MEATKRWVDDKGTYCVIYGHGIRTLVVQIRKGACVFRRIRVSLGIIRRKR